MRYLLLTLFILSTHATAEVYKTINPDGSTSYSDVPTNDQEPVKLPELTPAPAVKYPKKSIDKKKDDNMIALPYKSFTISSPENNAIIRDNNGNVTIQVNITPELQTSFKHSISFYLDGKIYKSGLSSNQIQMTNLDRGSHTISAKLLNANKKILKVTQTITIHVKRQSKLHPKASAGWPENIPLTITFPPQNAL